MKSKNISEILETKNKFQQELNSVLSAYLSGDELTQIKKLISNYYADQLIKEVDKVAMEKGWSQETYDSWLNENFRTPYSK